MDVLRDWINQAVRKAVSCLPYAGTYEYSVVACNKLLQTVSARSLSPSMPDLTNVPIMSPGLALELVPGTPIRVRFAGMDPTRPEVVPGSSGGLPPLVPLTGSGVLNELDAGYVLITQVVLPIPSAVAAVYFPAGLAGSIAAQAALLAATSAGLAAFLLHMNGGRVLPDAWTIP